MYIYIRAPNYNPKRKDNIFFFVNDVHLKRFSFVKYNYLFKIFSVIEGVISLVNLTRMIYINK